MDSTSAFLSVNIRKGLNWPEEFLLKLGNGGLDGLYVRNGAKGYMSDQDVFQPSQERWTILGLIYPNTFGIHLLNIFTQIPS